MHSNIINKIFSVSPEDFAYEAEEIFKFQEKENEVYARWCGKFNNRHQPFNLLTYPYLPISFFKQFSITTSQFKPAIIFESSGTTQTINSKHLVKDVEIYKQSFLKGFNLFYGDIEQYVILGLLPSYLERNNSSLVMMIDELIKQSKHTKSNFYLYNYAALFDVLVQLELQKQPTLLFGVTFALLDFAEQYPIKLNHTTIIETGGMKGRRKELTRQELHHQLTTAFGVEKIHSEYGMTELLSQAYSLGNGLFKCPPWMKVLVRDEEDPLHVQQHGKGILNVIDLANIYSCSFIATDDIGIVYEDGTFEVLGRLDNSDIRGCSLLIV